MRWSVPPIVFHLAFIRRPTMISQHCPQEQRALHTRLRVSLSGISSGLKDAGLIKRHPVPRSKSQELSLSYMARAEGVDCQSTSGQLNSRMAQWRVLQQSNFMSATGFFLLAPASCLKWTSRVACRLFCDASTKTDVFFG